MKISSIIAEFNPFHAGHSYIIDEMKQKNPEIFEIMMKDINLDEIKAYYEIEYLPLYKKCLNYLVQCAEASAENEIEQRRKLEEEIKTTHINEQKFKTIKKKIVDNSKGR